MADQPQTVRVTLNGEPHDLPAGLSVAGLLEHFALDARHTAVERNRALVPRAAFGATPVEDGDVLELVTLVGGG
jgi:thiamine biosynthesis protein ThiS